MAFMNRRRVSEDAALWHFTHPSAVCKDDILKASWRYHIGPNSFEWGLTGVRGLLSGLS